jgi:hypothetical protein
MNEIIPNLYLGSMHAGWNPGYLVSNKINYVLQVAPEIPGTRPQDPKSIRRWVLSVDDVPETQLYPYFSFTSNWIQYHLRSNQAVLVHCMAGISRSSTIIAAYLMSRYGWTRDYTIRYMRSKRPMVNPNPGFMYQLGEWERFLKKNVNARLH